MSAETQVNELLKRWEDAQKHALAPSPEALCRDCPELLPELKRRIEALQSIDRRMAGTGASLSEGTDIDPSVSPAEPPGPASAAGEPAEADWPSVPGYEIVAKIADGGMGVVYKARQVRLNRVVALKMILAGEHANADQLARFRSEAEAVARLQHPNIVQIYEVGEQRGLPYFSLEFVEGGSLADKLAGAPQPARQSAELVATLAQAVHAAHQRGIIHRDLKPANILLQIADSRLQSDKPVPGAEASAICNLKSAIPKITDFGLAKRLDAEAGRTQSGAIMGTPSYMAPEQATGQTKAIGPVTDVYALGAILYEMLRAGRRSVGRRCSTRWSRSARKNLCRRGNCSRRCRGIWRRYA
jgi:serine/threonine-protein kinase